MNRAELELIADALDRDNRELNWPAPAEIKTELPPAPDLDAYALLPKALAEFVLDEADRMPCPKDYIAAALIVALGSVIGARCAMKPKRRDDWLIVPNLYGKMVGLPSAKKTPAASAVLRFLDRLEAKEAAKLEERRKVYEAEKAAYEAHEAAVRQSMKKAASGEGNAAKMADAVDQLAALQPPEEPYQRRFKTSDSTVEALGVLLSKNPQGLFVFRDELVGLLASWEKEGHEGDRAFYLEAHTGTSSFNVDRISRPSIFIPNLCLSVFGGVQPDMLQRYLAGTVDKVGNDGAAQRFQMSVFPEPVAWEWRDRYPVPGAREAVRDLFERLATFDPLQDGAQPANDFVKLPHFQFDDQAQDLFVQWASELHTQWAPAETNPLMQQHLLKFEKLFGALALILHLAEGQVGDVSAATVIRAAAWCEYLRGHARRIYALVEASHTSTAKMVGRRIAEAKLEDGFTVRDLVRKQWSGCTTTLQAESALAVLEEHGWITGVETEPPTGRPTTRYLINPRVKVRR